MAKKKCYEYIDHTADIGIRGYGKTLPEALSNVAQGMVAAIHPLDQVEIQETREFGIQAVTLDDLIVQFLNHLLYLHEVEGFIPKKYQLKVSKSRIIQGIISGEKFNPAKHQIYDEVKAVTYHQLKVEHQDNEWMIQVICDL